MDLGLLDKLAIVTGGSKGIGAAVAATLARAGCDVVVVARTSETSQCVASQLAHETGRKVTAVAADLSNSQEIDALAAAWGHADILVNNAGAIPGGRLDEVDEVAWRKAWDLKVFGYVNMTRQFLARMCGRGGGVVVNIIGIAARTRDPSYICGVAGNAALEAFTMALGSDSQRHGVRVVGLHPGPVATERLGILEERVDSSKLRPFGRAASPGEIAAAAAFLASPLSGYTSGTVLTVDGGISARSTT